MHANSARRRIARRICMALVIPLGLGGVLLFSGLASAQGSAHGGAHGSHGATDVSTGFRAQPVAPPAVFRDGVSAMFKVKYDSGGTTVANVPRDASNVLIAAVSWDPGGSSGWHTHPGPVIVKMTEGEVAVTNADDCVTRNYKAGEAFLDPGQGNVHIARNASSEDAAAAYAVFLDVPPGGPATQWTAPKPC